MKWLLVLFLLLPLPADDSDFYARLVDFHKKYISFVLEYEGCSQHVVVNNAGTPQNCESAGSFDVKKFNASKKAAMKLYGLVPAP